MASTLPQRPTLALLFCVTLLKGYLLAGDRQVPELSVDAPLSHGYN